MNEGEYLELVNDLKEQYHSMKQSLLFQIMELEEELKLKQHRFPFAYVTTQFYSPRPTAQQPVYSSYLTPAFYYCYLCSNYHPSNAVCLY